MRRRKIAWKERARRLLQAAKDFSPDNFYFVPFALLYVIVSSAWANFYAAIAVSFSVLAWRAANSAVMILRPFSVTT